MLLGFKTEAFCLGHKYLLYVPVFGSAVRAYMVLPGYSQFRGADARPRGDTFGSSALRRTVRNV